MKCYLDYNATCPPLPEALERFMRVAREAGANPSSLHWAGRAARKALEDAREMLAAFVGAEPGAVVFTSGATEANHVALTSAVGEAKSGELIASAIEHPSMREAVRGLAERRRMRVRWLRPERNGRVPPEAIAHALDEAESPRALVLMWVNNETGVIQPVEEAVRLARAREVPVIVDGVQALGKLPVDAGALDADYLTLSAHKIGGVKGIGALVVRRGVKVRDPFPGGGQERGRRSGTENPPAAAAFAAALGRIDFAAYAPLRDRFEAMLKEAVPDAVIFGEGAPRVGNVSMFGVPGMDGETLLMQLDLAGFAVSAGSACASGKHEPSYVLAAMRAPKAAARGAIRVSLGPGVEEAHLEALVRTIADARARLAAMAGQW